MISMVVDVRLNHACLKLPGYQSWIHGRVGSSGSLEVSDPVTEETTISLTNGVCTQKRHSIKRVQPFVREETHSSGDGDCWTW